MRKQSLVTQILAVNALLILSTTMAGIAAAHLSVGDQVEQQQALIIVMGIFGAVLVNGIFAAVPYCIDLLGGPYVETVEEVVKAFRPKSALRPPAKAGGEEAPKRP